MDGGACAYTALFGHYEDLLEQPVAIDSDMDFICFTDDPSLRSDTWEIRVVRRVIQEDPARSSRYPKICPHRFLEEYDVSLYIDNSVLLTTDPSEILEDLLPDDAVFAAIEHSFRDTVLDEFRAVVSASLDSEWVCAEQLEHYKRSHSDVLAQKPLIGGVLLRRHMDPDVISAMELWWFNVLRYSRRDQLSLRVALSDASLRPTTWPVDVRDNGYWIWPASTGRIPQREPVLPGHLGDRANIHLTPDESA